MTDIKPALTREEWEEALAGMRPDLYRNDYGTQEGYHKSAALGLRNQPFGFTREDVAMCLDEAANEAADAGIFENTLEARWRSLAARIEALLPPEEDND